MENSFDIFFKPGHEHIRSPQKKDYSNLVNLSSNQFESTIVLELFKKFIHQVNINCISQYTYIEPIRHKVAEIKNISSTQLLFGPGSDIFIYLLLENFSHKIKEIIINYPNYQSYFDFSVFHDMKINKIEFVNKDKKTILNHYLNAVAKTENSLVVITNPDNFIGDTLAIDAIEEIIVAAGRTNCLVLIDEAYADFSTLNHRLLLNKYNNLIILKTLSKSYAMAGIRLCEIISSEKMIDYFKKTGIEKSCSSLSLKFYSYLLENQHLVNEAIKNVIYNREKAKILINNESLSVYNSQTNFITIDTQSKELAYNLVSQIHENGFALKQLYLHDTPSALIRLTIPEKFSIIENIYTFMENV